MPSPNIGGQSADRGRRQHASEKEDNNMYPFNKLDFNMGDIHDRYEGVMGPLTLFAPYPHEDQSLIRLDSENIPKQKPEEKEPEAQRVELERPVTPIDEEIRIPPGTFAGLAKLVRRRISAKPEVEYLGVEDQKELAAIVMGEVNGIWPDIRKQVDDPFLSPDENKELQRRISVHIVTVCEQLFNHYIKKAQILNKRGVFSGPANMSRLKAQLSLDANKFLNILTIRRYIVGDLRQKTDEECDTEEEYRQLMSGLRKPSIPEQPAPLLSYKGLIEQSRPKTKTKKKRYLSPRQEVRNMIENMPGLNTEKLMELVSDLPRMDGASSKITASHSQVTEPAPKARLPGESRKRGEVGPSENVTLEEISRSLVVMKKSSSVPHLAVGETLLEELGIEDGRDSVNSLADEAPLFPDRNQRAKAAGGMSPEPGSREYVAEDLKKLVGKREEEEKEDDDDLPPLLQALTRSARHDNKQESIDRQLQELEERERQRQESEIITLQEASHPQPATVSTKLSNQMVVRTSDVRVSERVCLSSITLQKNATVYNDLIDEIDPATVKSLDSNLFLGDEITEVYREIMKTVPTDHLSLENDELIEPAADSVNLNTALASATLSRKPTERVINPALQQSSEPPWGNMAVKDWAQTPLSPPKDVRGRPLVHPMTPRGDGKASQDYFGEGFKPPEADQAKTVLQEVMARSYASWLQWWKNTINTDDYMKYVSTQESDYMGVVFHFYNSEDEEDEEDETSQTRSEKRSRQIMEEEKVKKLEEMRAAKADYKEGFWNVNSVLLGGLGKDPGLEEDEEEKAKTPDSADATTPAKFGRSRTMLVSRKSQKTVSQAKTGQDERMSPARSPIRTREGLSPTSHPSRPDTKASGVSPRGKTEKVDPTAQERLEKVWTQLKMPDSRKLDMAIKYSSDAYHAKLEEAIDVWERVTGLILKREQLVTKLEKFERLASDPNRFFERGFRGSSVARLEEARIRSTYYRKIDTFDWELRQMLEEVEKDLQDIVTFQGRPYADKMKWDRTEMLYWLQEERKQQAMDYESRVRNLPPLSLKMAPLPPITPQLAASVK